MIPLFVALVGGVQAPDSVRQARIERAMTHAIDSVGVAQGAVAGFRTDIAQASWALVLQRAGRVQLACRGADTALAELQTALAAGSYARNTVRSQAALQNGTAEARHVLARCQREWAVPARPAIADADTLRAWGPYRSAQLDNAMRRYLATVRTFRRAAGLK